MKAIIIGSAQHGKDTVAEMINEITGMTYTSSSQASLDAFLFPILKEKYGLKYGSKEEAFEDRVNHRDIWYNEISIYNSEDKSRLARAIMENNDIYVGMRSNDELKACMEKKVFDKIIAVHNPRIPKEDRSSNTINILDYANDIIVNDSTLEDLKRKIENFCKFALNHNAKKMALIENPRIEYHEDRKTYKELKFFFFNDEDAIIRRFKKEEEAIPIAEKFVGKFKQYGDKLQPVLEKLISKLKD